MAEKINLEITLDNGQFIVNSKQSEKAIKNIGKTAKKTATATEKAFNLIKLAMASAIGAKIIGFLKASVKAASDLEEVTGKFNVVFKEQLQLAEKMSKELVAGYAMSTRESKQYLASIQDLLVPMGMVADEAAVMSGEVVKFAADLASFNNTTTAQTMADIQSALVGNFETMKKYAVVLNETRLRQEAVNMGLHTGKGQIDAVTKSLVAYRIMLKDSSLSQNDMARTANSFANRMKKLAATGEDVKAALGKPLMKAIADVTMGMDEGDESAKEYASTLGEILASLLKITALLAKGAVQFFAPSVKAIALTRKYRKEIEKTNQAIDKSIRPRRRRRRKPAGDTGKKPEKQKELDVGSFVEAEQIQAQAIVDFERASYDQRAGLYENYASRMVGTAQNLYSNLNDINQQYAQNELARIDRSHNTRAAFIQATITGEEERTQALALLDLETQRRKAGIQRKAARQQREFNTFQTIIDTATGAMSAYKAMAGIPIVGPILGSIAAGAATALGIAKIALIRSAPLPTAYAEGTTRVPRTEPAMVHEGEMVIPRNIAEGIRAGELSLGSGQGQGGLVVNVEGSIIDLEGLLQIVDEQRSKRAFTLGANNYEYGSAY